jgi:hypothetical protein
LEERDFAPTLPQVVDEDLDHHAPAAARDSWKPKLQKPRADTPLDVRNGIRAHAPSKISAGAGIELHRDAR